jgi:hypothetical protein
LATLPRDCWPNRHVRRIPPIVRERYIRRVHDPHSGTDGLMRYALALSALLAACAAPPKVDRQLVGTWELMVPNADGVARWVWEIRANGTYAFHAEGPGNVPAHSGTFGAFRGLYVLESTTMAWADTGTYLEPHNDTLTASGKLGTGAWHRIRLGINQPATPSAPPAAPPPVAVEPPPPPPPASSPDTEPTPHGKPAIFNPPDIYSFLRNHSMDESQFPDKSAKITSYTTVSTENAGEIGATRTTVREGVHPDDQVDFRVFRDRAAAEAAYRMLTETDATGFQQRPGEFIATSSFTFHAHGISRCLSRYMVHESAPARISCYLLIIDPTEEAVMIVGTTSEQPASGSNQASDAAFSHADDLIFAGLEFWEPVRLGVQVLGALNGH